MPKGPLTERDIEIKKLGLEVRKLIKTSKDWNKFVWYMDFYYKDQKRPGDKQ